jgi:GAF domain-containing protein
VTVPEALAGAARTFGSQQTVDETLDVIVEAAEGAIPGIDHVGVSIARRNDAIETVAGTDPLARELDALQHDLHDGPCHHAIRSPRRVVVMEQARQQRRWPRYVPEAVRRGVRSQVSLLLYVDKRTLGGLNLYSTSRETLDPHAIHVAELFATHAALALANAREVGELIEGLAARKTIGQALGILMERYHISEDAAFAFLSRTSQTSNTKLRDLAGDLVDNTQARAEEMTVGP